PWREFAERLKAVIDALIKPKRLAVALSLVGCITLLYILHNNGQNDKHNGQNDNYNVQSDNHNVQKQANGKTSRRKQKNTSDAANQNTPNTTNQNISTTNQNTLHPTNQNIATEVSTRPIPLSSLRPNYTEEARKNRVQGVIRARALVWSDGSVR